MRINVEQRHIDNGIRMSCTKCPVALAIREATGRELDVKSRRVFENAEPIAFLPDEVSGWIRSFDVYWENEGYTPKPISFDIEL